MEKNKPKEEKWKKEPNKQKEKNGQNEPKEQTRQRNFVEIDEEFVCEHCGKLVPKLGYSCRNHCPHCLHSKHVDKNPGDRRRRMSWRLRAYRIRNRWKKRLCYNFQMQKMWSNQEKQSCKR